ncbi:MAG: nucleotidyltransferase family protein [Actinomycetota bacterium]
MSTEARDQESAKAVFREVVSLLEGHDLPYAVGGSLATHHWTDSSASIGDVDILIRESDGPDILRLLGREDFETQEMAHSWLHKAFKSAVTVDLMFRLKNDATLDGDLVKHRSRVEMLGTVAYVMAVEDQIAALAATVDRQTVGEHWYSIVDLMASNDLDWDYLAKRLQGDPLRAISVLYFALGEEVPVEKRVLEKLTSLL